MLVAVAVTTWVFEDGWLDWRGVRLPCGVLIRVLRMRTRIAVVAALTLVVGFAVASLTGSRPLGGVVLVVGGALCTWWMARAAGVVRAFVTLVVAVALFVVSHPLGLVIGAWPSVLLVAAAAGAVAYALARPPDRLPATADRGPTAAARDRG